MKATPQLRDQALELARACNSRAVAQNDFLFSELADFLEALAEAIDDGFAGGSLHPRHLINTGNLNRR